MVSSHNDFGFPQRPAQSRMAACLLLTLWLAPGGIGRALADGPPSPSDPGSVADYSAAECLQKAGAMVGKPIDLIRLLGSKHLRAGATTSITDLAAMASEHDLRAEVYQDLTIAQLRHATFPVVLRVRINRYATKPDHYIVCLGIQGDQARIFNPPMMERTVPLEMFATRWSGEALILATGDSKVNLAIWRYESHLPAAALAATALVCIVAMRMARRWIVKTGPRPATGAISRLILQPASLLIVAAVLGFGCRFVLGQGWTVQAATPASPEGPDPMDFQLHTDAAGVVAEKVVEVDSQTALGLHAGGALFVDARDPGEFAAGRIKGAMNCPAGDVGHMRLNMAGISKERKIAVYCVSSHCGKGHYLAQALMQQGYSHVVLYRDGWEKWTGPKEP